MITLPAIGSTVTYVAKIRRPMIEVTGTVVAHRSGKIIVRSEGKDAAVSPLALAAVEA